MTVKRERAIRNAIASARMEGLPVSTRTQQECVRFLDGKLDAASFVQEILKQRNELAQ